MDITAEQEKFYKSFQNMTEEEQQKMMCEARECVKTRPAVWHPRTPSC